jgi:hypothetical protein
MSRKITTDKLTDSKTKVVCGYCNKEFIKWKKEVKANNFCDAACAQNHRTKDTVTLPCAYCQEPVRRSRAEHRDSKSGNVFCNRSCSAEYNNRFCDNLILSRKVAQGQCVDCGSPILSHSKRKRCQDCVSASFKKGEDCPIWKLVNVRGAKSNAYSAIRYRARKVAEEHLEYTKCQVCGYDKYVEICHKKGISEFNEDTLVSIVNDPNNLLVLCPNHHKELDRGIMDGSLLESPVKCPISESN